MNARFSAFLRGLGLVGLLALAGCATPPSPVADSAVATLPATEAQTLLTNSRGQAIVSRLSFDEQDRLMKRPCLAIRTLAPDQAAAPAGTPPAAICVMVWNAKTKSPVGADCYLMTTEPKRDTLLKLGPHTVRYAGSL